MNEFMGAGNGVMNYLSVLVLYAVLFVVMRHANPVVELNFRKTYWILYFGWAVGVFIGNYVFFRLGYMSFLPWINNLLHTFIWIGFCLTFLYAGCYRKPFWEQFILFTIFSLVVKAFERNLLGTWELDHFYWIQGNNAYIIGWSLMDGLYPIISKVGLRFIARFTSGVVVP
ncbi:MAG: hypothetical protein HW412_1385 [Bacteroidetes bacterium]|nr:hypothetical protein [Bacteroidota bacterium]